MRDVNPGLSRIIFFFLLASVMGLAGCDTTGIQPDLEDPQTPLSEAEFKARMAEDGVVVLEPKDYEAFGINNTDLRLREKTSASARCQVVGGTSSTTISLYTYSLCTDVTTESFYNVNYTRVTIDAEITKNFVCPNDPVIMQEPTMADIDAASKDADTKATLKCPSTVSVTSSTTRDDGTVLQQNQTDTGTQQAETNFVALYPATDTFVFNHVYAYSPVNGILTATVAP